MNNDYDPETGISRREFLVGGCGLLAGLALKDVLELIDRTASHEVQRDKQVYESGDTIPTPYGNLLVQGWSIGVPHDLVEGARAQGVELDFRLKDQHVNSRIGTNYSTNFSVREVDGKPVYFMRIFPTTDGEDTVLTMDEKNAGLRSVVQETSQAFFVRTKVYTETGRDDGVILSEPPIKPERLRDIANIREIFSEFVLNPSNVYVLEHATEEAPDASGVSGGFNIYERGTIVLYKRAFTHPYYDGEALGTATHEFAHDIVKYLLTFDGDQRPTYLLSEAYKPIAETYDGDTKGPLTLSDILTESTYITAPGKPPRSSKAGHPQDSFNEMFASTLTILRLHYEPFIEALNNLEDEQRKKVVRFVEAVFISLLSINDSEEALSKMFPNLERMQKDLGFS